MKIATGKSSRARLIRQILIVDDDLAVLEILANILRRHYPKYEVLRANTGHLGLLIAEDEAPDLIITDWEMPGMSGLELLKTLKQNPHCRDIPVIVCTGIMTSPDDLGMALALGAFDYVRKPLDEIELVARIRSTLRFMAQMQEIQHLNESKDIFFSILASEFSISVQQSQYQLEQLNQQLPQLPAKTLDHLQKARDQLGQSEKKLSKLMHWAQLRFASTQVQLCLFQLRPFIFSQCEVWHGSGFAVEIDLSSQYWIESDPNLLHIVIQELLQNAKKQGASQIYISAQKKQGELWLSFYDNGPGLSEEKFSQLLQPFSAHSKDYQSQQQVCLGLKICREILSLLNSQLIIQPPPQTVSPRPGACFTFSVPLKTKPNLLQQAHLR